MRHYLLLILATLLVFISIFFIISFYFLSKLSSNEKIIKSSSRNEFDDEEFEFPDVLDISLLPSNYRDRNPKLDLIKSKLVKAFKACDSNDQLNFSEVWNEANSVR